MAERQPEGDILDLEEELEREREDASRAFEEVQERLKRAGSDPRLQEETQRRLPEQSEQIAQELKALEAQMDERTRDDASDIQRRLGELAAEIDSAGRHLDQAEARLEAESERLRGETAARVEDAAKRAEEATTARVRREAEERARVEIEELSSALDRERSSSAQKVEAAEERVRAAQQKATEAEEARLDREVDARSHAAQWLRSQTRAIEARAEKTRREQVAAARRDAIEKVSREAEQRIAREREKAVRKQGISEQEVARYRELRGRIGSARETATPARDRAAAGGLELPEPELRDEKPAAPRGKKDLARAERAERKAELRRAAEERKAERIRAAKEKRAVADAKRAARATAESAKLDLNEATFEELRRVGLSVTQATRVIADRQRRGGFESVDDLDTTPGFPKSFLEELKERLSA